MPERQTIQRAQRDKRAGKAPSTQAGEFVREEFDHIREGKHGARSTRQAIAIGLSKARRSGVELQPPAEGKAPQRTVRRAERDYERGHGAPAKRAASGRRRAASRAALARESHEAASPRAIASQAHQAASRRSPGSRSEAARKAARTKGSTRRSAAARRAARTRSAHPGNAARGDDAARTRGSARTSTRARAGRSSRPIRVTAARGHATRPRQSRQHSPRALYW